MNRTEGSDFENWLHDQTKNLPEPEVSPEFLAAQRRAIYRRLDSPQCSLRLRWAVSFAMLLLVIAGSLTLEQRRHRTPALTDDQLFSDLSAMEQTNEPKAIQPIHGLFQDGRSQDGLSQE